VSAANSKVASYHFTTLKPKLGVVRMGDEESFVIADVPGLIEGAHEGVGLGDRFLKHIERCKLIIHIVDISGIDGREPEEDFLKINRELRNYSEKLSNKIQIVAANKIDMLYDEEKYTKSFDETTLQPLLKEFELDYIKAGLKKIYKKLRQCYAFEFRGKKFLCTHGGLPLVPSLALVSAREMIKGVGRYETEIGEIYSEN